MSLKAAPYRWFYDRQSTTNIGAFTLQHAATGKPVIHDGVVFKRIKGLSGSKAQAHTEWVTGKSGIPYGRAFLWLKPVNPGTKPGVAGIGEFWPISDMLDDSTVIWSPDKKQKRLHIGQHADNAIPGSAGCIVHPYTGATTQQRETWKALSAFYRWCIAKGWDYIPGEVL
jgi:hypothetical protein